MGRGRQGSGVEPLASSIRLRFTYNGKRRYETLDLAPTPPNIKAAQRLMAQIRRELDAGVFEYGAHFPDSAPLTEIPTFRKFAKEWLESKVLEQSTLENYRPHLRWWAEQFGDTPIDRITPMSVQKAVASRAAMVSAKSVNNALIPLRGVFAAAETEGLIAKDPTEKIKNLKFQKPSPDPFVRDEMEKIIAYLERYPEPIWGFYTLAFLTGLRPSEQHALRWGDIDWDASKIIVRRARVRGKEKGTKSNRERYVDISPRALTVLRRMKKHTLMRGDDQEVFCNPSTANGWKQDDLQARLDTYWYPTLKALGIRRRISYQTRHTYATTLLMAGVNIAWLARQLGHASAKVTLERYARWIDGADSGAEAGKAAEVFERIGQELATKNKKA
jgi:integrase